MVQFISMNESAASLNQTDVDFSIPKEEEPTKILGEVIKEVDAALWQYSGDEGTR